MNAVTSHLFNSMVLGELTISDWAAVIVAVAAVVIVVLAVAAWNWWSALYRTSKEADLAEFVRSVQRSLQWIIKHSNAKDKVTRDMVRDVEQRLSELIHREMNDTRDIIRDVRSSVINFSQTDVSGGQANIGDKNKISQE